MRFLQTKSHDLLTATEFDISTFYDYHLLLISLKYLAPSSFGQYAL